MSQGINTTWQEITHRIDLFTAQIGLHFLTLDINFIIDYIYDSEQIDLKLVSALAEHTGKYLRQMWFPESFLIKHRPAVRRQCNVRRAFPAIRNS